jgi:hypothetical protein
MAKLRVELFKAFPNPDELICLKTAEQLPYLVNNTNSIRGIEELIKNLRKATCLYSPCRIGSLELTRFCKFARETSNMAIGLSQQM